MENTKSIVCDLGVYDIPSVQLQPDFKVDLLKSNIAVFGSSMGGKTNFLKLLINILHQKCDEKTEQIFILDFSGAMRDYVDMPLVSAYFDNSNEEYVKRVFKLLENILKTNTKELGSSNFSSFTGEMKHTTFIVDNINAFLDETRYSSYHEKFGRLCREGRSRGISIVFSASDTKGTNSYQLCFEQKVALNFPVDKCMDLFSSKLDALGNIAGRGYANVTVKPDGITGTFNMNAPYEVQIRLASDFKDDNSLFKKILNIKYRFDSQLQIYENTAKKYQTFPEELKHEDFERLRQPFSPDEKIDEDESVFVGLDYVDFKPIGINFSESRAIAIYGKKEFGKTNLLKLLLKGLADKKPGSNLIFFDDGRGQLKQLYEKYLGFFGEERCRYIHEFCKVSLELKDGRTVERKLSPIQQFYHLLHEKYINTSKDYDNQLLEQIYGVDDEYVMVDDIPAGAEKNEAPPTIFIIQTKSLYLNAKISQDLVKYILPELLDVAEDRDHIFIFTDVKKLTDAEANSVFNSMLKTVFLLDNIAEFAGERGSKSVFGDMDIKSLKEDYAKCELGDGYYYDVEADSLKKGKFILDN